MNAEPRSHPDRTMAVRLAGKRHPWRWVAGTAVVLASVMSASVWHAVTDADHAEKSLHGTLLTLDLVTAHVRAHHGKWPRSWSDLERQHPEGRYLFRWPEDVATVREYVTVDFEADPVVVAQQSKDEFAAVRPVGPSFSYRGRWQLEALLAAVREFQAPSTD
jgi:hypothetical protein